MSDLGRRAVFCTWKQADNLSPDTIRLPYFELGLGGYLFAARHLVARPAYEMVRNGFERLPHRQIFALNSGRFALALALRVLRRAQPRRGEVIIPAYICPAVVGAAEDAGLRPGSCGL